MARRPKKREGQGDGRLPTGPSSGFKDDIVIRVSPEGKGSRLDVPSLSRVGRSDFGVNAKRIVAYMKALATV